MKCDPWEGTHISIGFNTNLHFSVFSASILFSRHMELPVPSGSTFTGVPTTIPIRAHSESLLYFLSTPPVSTLLEANALNATVPRHSQMLTLRWPSPQNTVHTLSTVSNSTAGEPDDWKAVCRRGGLIARNSQTTHTTEKWYTDRESFVRALMAQNV